ncbi:hypothetical protein HDV05_002629 [Chytridiales sp. JEL 0842]|nr:hypothetical protein HDV05_002629 [Chytridiales sp. JEL 0842]
MRTLSELSEERGASFVKQVWLAHNRGLKQQWRNAQAIFLELMVSSLAGLVMGASAAVEEMYQGILAQPYLPLSSVPNDWHLGLYATLMAVAIAASAGPAGCKIFVEEKAMYWREAASGHSKAAYFLGKNVSSLYRQALSAAHFTAIYYYFATPSISLLWLYIIIFLNFFCNYGLAVLISMSCRRENAALLSVVFGMFVAIFDGYAPNLKDALASGYGYLFHLGSNRWAAEALYGLALEQYEGLYDLQISADYLGYELNVLYRNIIMMVVLGIAYRAVGFVLMVTVHRDKQK